MICINECFLALGEKNDLCPCGKYCESNVIFKLSFILLIYLVICLGGCPCLDCENCWDCKIPTECRSKDEEKKVFSSISISFFIYFHLIWKGNINISVSKSRIKNKLNAWATVLEMTVLLAMKRTRRTLKIVLVGKIVLVRSIRIQFVCSKIIALICQID